MPELDDMALPREYAAGKLEAAVATLVARHVNFVHSAALRQTGADTHCAGEITQVVFVILARKGEWNSAPCGKFAAGGLPIRNQAG